MRRRSRRSQGPCRAASSTLAPSRRGITRSTPATRSFLTSRDTPFATEVIVRLFHSLALACAFASVPASAVTFTLNTTDEYGQPLAQTRSYTVYRPSGLSTAAPVPAIIVLLGSGSLTAAA